MLMLTGKYWITPHGVVDVSASEHALYAKNFMLRLLGTNREVPLTKDLFAPISTAEAASHAKRGISKKVLKFLQSSDSDGQMDARIYAIRELGWIRIRRSEFYVWQLNDKTLLKLYTAKKYWSNQANCDELENVTIWTLSTWDAFRIPVAYLKLDN